MRGHQDVGFPIHFKTYLPFKGAMMIPVDHVHFSHATLHHVGAADHKRAHSHHASGDPLSNHMHSGGNAIVERHDFRNARPALLEKPIIRFQRK